MIFFKSVSKIEVLAIVVVVVGEAKTIATHRAADLWHKSWYARFWSQDVPGGDWYARFWCQDFPDEPESQRSLESRDEQRASHIT